MKIQLKNKIVDTDTMADKQAEIYEALATLKAVCKKYNVTSFARVIIDKKNFLGMNTVVEAQDKEVIQKDFDFLLDCINQFVTRSTDSKVIMMRQRPPESEDPS